MKVSKVEKVLELINRIHKIDKGFKVYLHSEFVDSMLWKDIDLWMALFENLCNKKSKDMKKQKNNNIMGLFNNVQKFIGGNKSDDKIEIVSL